MVALLKPNGREETKANLEGMAIGLAQAVRDSLLRSGASDRRSDFFTQQALDAADELTAVMGALREYQ